MKKLVSLLCVFLLAGCQNKIQVEHQDKIKILSISDPHYYSKQLTDGEEGFQIITKNGDGKMLSNSDALLDYLLEKAIDEHADVLLVSGDLTFNGEKASHEDLSLRLKEFEEKGIDVFVIPGNHDLNNFYSRSFFEDMYYRVENIDERIYETIYKDFGYENTYRDPESLSYIAPLSDDLWLLALECDSKFKGGRISDETLKFVEEKLEYASKHNIQVISMSHENLFVHNKRFSDFQIKGNEKLIELFKKYNVKLNLSGHLHIQHSILDDGILDIAQSSLSIPTHNLGVITIDDNRQLNYQLSSLDFDKKETIDFFEQNTVLKFGSKLNESNLSKKEKDDLLKIAIQFNNDYFGGTIYQNLDYYKSEDVQRYLSDYQNKFSFVRYITESLSSTIQDESYFSLNLKD